MMVTSTQNRLFTVDEYYKMAEAGILRQDDRVELIGGEIKLMTPIGKRHSAYVDRLVNLFYQFKTNQFNVRSQNPLFIDEYNEPEPDLMLLEYNSRFYQDSPPTPSNVFLLVEIADSSLLYDKKVKMPLYAQAGICEAWLVDITNDTVVVHRQPESLGYKSVEILRHGQSISPLTLPDMILPVSEILG